MLRICVLAAVTATAAGLVFGVWPGAARDQERVISLLSVQQGGSLIDVDQSGGDGPTDHAERAVERATMTGK